MNIQPDLEHCFSFIHCQIQPPDRTGLFAENNHRRCAITISRQSGCGAHAVAEKLVRYLQPHTLPDEPRWTFFDRNLVEQVLAEHQLPERLARYMPEDRVLEIDDIMDEVFGLHPSSWTLIHQIAETILRLADVGNVIILGRGANIITARLPHVLHVRMIGSLDRRIENMQHFEGLNHKDAAERIRHEDLGRERYLKKHFAKDINDPLHYHLVINTDLVTPDDIVQLIGHLALSRKLVTA